MKYKVLFADDNPETLLGLRIQLKSHLDIEGVFVERASEAIELIKSDPTGFAAVVLDFHFEPEKTNGAEVAKQLFVINRKLSIVICTGDTSALPPIQSLKVKVSDFVTKEDTEGLIIAIRNCFPYYDQVVRVFNGSQRSVKEKWIENAELIKSMGMRGQSDQLAEVCRSIAKIADRSSTVLIRGEHGTGKELVAKALHQKSHRHQRNFVSLNCAAITPTLLESELFGHEKGAFTGADKKQPGKFELAHKGTIFLDEIGEMSTELQAKLLRVLQEGQFYPVGSKQEVKVDVRVVAATNVDITKAISDGKFRADLFFRLNVIPIDLVPLRARKEDIEPLVTYFASKFGREGVAIKFKTFELLKSYDWPGNVRELSNTIERLFALAEGTTIGPEELAEKFFQPKEKINLEASYSCKYDVFMKGLTEYVEEQESEYLLTNLRKLGSVRALSKYLDMPRTSLQRKLKSVGYSQGSELGDV